MSRVNSHRIGTAVRLAKRLMPVDGDLDGLVENLGQHRGRDIHILSREFAGRATSGLWLQADHADFLVVDEPTTPSRRAAIICHEVAHMLLEHEANSVSSDAIATLAPDLGPALIARALARHAYGTEDESEAEQAATMIGAEHSRRQINSSRLA